MANTIHKNIKQLRAANGLTLKELAEKLGVKEATAQRYESGEIKNIKYETIIKLSEIFGCSPAVIMGWEIPMIKHNINFKDKMASYPFIPQGVSAGVLMSIDAVKEFETIEVPDIMLGKYARSENIILMRVNGESMNNIITHGAIIALKTDIDACDLNNNDIVVISNEGEYTVKRFYNDKINKRYIFRPDSSCPEFTDIIFSYDNCNDLQLIGKVVMYNVFL
nr:MAG TPA: helix-turn-helix domain protein [Caudoviricetes sp.]